MSQFREKKCSACEGGVEALDLASAKKYMQEIPQWEIDPNGKYIIRKLAFKGFYPTMNFVNAVAFIAQKEGHHPDLEVGYNYCNIKYTTHAIDGLSENDFICAAKIDVLLS